MTRVARQSASTTQRELPPRDSVPCHEGTGGGTVGGECGGDRDTGCCSHGIGWCGAGRRVLHHDLPSVVHNDDDDDHSTHQHLLPVHHDYDGGFDHYVLYSDLYFDYERGDFYEYDDYDLDNYVHDRSVDHHDD